MSSTLAAHARGAGVTDERLLAALTELDRAHFLPDDARAAADEDRPLTIGHGQTASQPSLQARMIEPLRLTGHERVLELGTGAGYQTALLARLAAEVFTVDVDRTLSERAQRALTDLGITNVRFVVADGLEGCARAAPYDGVLVSFAVPRIPDPIVDGLVEGGRVVAPILDPHAAPSEGRCDVITYERENARLVEKQFVCGAHFVRARSLGRRS